MISFSFPSLTTNNNLSHYELSSGFTQKERKILSENKNQVKSTESDTLPKFLKSEVMHSFIILKHPYYTKKLCKLQKSFLFQ